MASVCPDGTLEATYIGMGMKLHDLIFFSLRCLSLFSHSDACRGEAWLMMLHGEAVRQATVEWANIQVSIMLFLIFSSSTFLFILVCYCVRL